MSAKQNLYRSIALLGRFARAMYRPRENFSTKISDYDTFKCLSATYNLKQRHVHIVLIQLYVELSNNFNALFVLIFLALSLSGSVKVS